MIYYSITLLPWIGFVGYILNTLYISVTSCHPIYLDTNKRISTTEAEKATNVALTPEINDRTAMTLLLVTSAVFLITKTIYSNKEEIS
jgi:hypothetical protein